MNNTMVAQPPIPHNEKLEDDPKLWALAEALLQIESGRPLKKLASLDPGSRERFLEDAALALYALDRGKQLHAVYTGIDRAGVFALESMTREGRRGLTEHYTRFLAGFKATLRGAYTDRARALGAVAVADLEADRQAKGGR